MEVYRIKDTPTLTGHITDNQYTPLAFSKLKAVVDEFNHIPPPAIKHEKIQHEELLVYCLTRYLAGDTNLQDKHAEIETLNLLLYKELKLAPSPQLKKISEQTALFHHVGQQLAGPPLNTEAFVQTNKLLLSHNKKSGLRVKSIMVGDPSIRDFAFRTCQAEHIPDLFRNLITFLNDESIDLIQRLILTTIHFYLIHPFKDGNGRTWRCVFLSLLAKKYNTAYASLLVIYFKLISPIQFYQIQKPYRPCKSQSTKEKAGKNPPQGNGPD